MECVNRTQVSCDAIQTLDALLPALRGHSHYLRWKSIITDAIAAASELPITKLRAEVYIHFGEAMLSEGEAQFALQAANVAFSHVVETDDIQTQLRCYILYFRTAPQRGARDIAHRHIYHALQLAKKLSGTDSLRASLYQALSSLYTYRQRTRASKHYLRSAFRIWRALRNTRGRIDCALISAYNARIERRYHQVDRLLSLLKDRVSSPDTLHYHGHLLYARAMAALERDQPASAIADLHAALEKFNVLKAQSMLAHCHYVLALAYITTQNYPPARHHLAKAQQRWKQAAYLPGQIDVQLGLSYLARMRGNLLLAMEYLARASALAEDITDVSTRSAAEENITDQTAQTLMEWEQMVRGQG
jgi:tetratricopeptide (TPR) repeat protein